mgnify:CR=1 FL=1
MINRGCKPSEALYTRLEIDCIADFSVLGVLAAKQIALERGLACENGSQIAGDVVLRGQPDLARRE